MMETKMERKTALAKIIGEYGVVTQERQLFEEMAELTVALNKAWRIAHGYLPNSKEEMLKARKNVIEEIADVEVMLEQAKLMWNCEAEVEQVKIDKINRQLQRIETNKG